MINRTEWKKLPWNLIWQFVLVTKAETKNLPRGTYLNTRKWNKYSKYCGRIGLQHLKCQGRGISSWKFDLFIVLDDVVPRTFATNAPLCKTLSSNGIRGSKGRAKSTMEFKVIMSLPYKGKYTLLRIDV